MNESKNLKLFEMICCLGENVKRSEVVKVEEEEKQAAVGDADR